MSLLGHTQVSSDLVLGIRPSGGDVGLSFGYRLVYAWLREPEQCLLKRFPLVCTDEHRFVWPVLRDRDLLPGRRRGIDQLVETILGFGDGQRLHAGIVAQRQPVPGLFWRLRSDWCRDVRPLRHDGVARRGPGRRRPPPGAGGPRPPAGAGARVGAGQTAPRLGEFRRRRGDPGPRALARQLEKLTPDAAGCLREGLAEMFTVTRLGVTGALLRTVASTNPVESMIEIVRDHARNVKRWKDGDMRLRLLAGAPRPSNSELQPADPRICQRLTSRCAWRSPLTSTISGHPPCRWFRRFGAR